MVLLGGRLFIRRQKNGNLLSDDYIHVAATAVLVGYCALYTAYYRLYYDVEYSAAGDGHTVSDSDLVTYFKVELAVSMLFWVIIYLVKANFLALYWIFFSINRRFRAAWYAVASFTAITFLFCFLSTISECGSPQNLFNPGA